jgi:hypothetical protein
MSINALTRFVIGMIRRAIQRFAEGNVQVVVSYLVKPKPVALLRSQAAVRENHGHGRSSRPSPPFAL